MKKPDPRLNGPAPAPAARRKLALNKDTIKDLGAGAKADAVKGGLSQQITCSRMVLTQSCQVAICNPGGT